MNTKWFSGIGLVLLLGVGTFIYTSKTQARQSATPAVKDATLENLTTCATEKNPAYLESVLKGAMAAFDKDAKPALKEGKPAEFKIASKKLLKVIKFLFVQSKHFSPIYKDAAHKAIFDKDINAVIQTLLKAEYALAKSKAAKKEVLKDYTAVVAELKKDGVEKLTPIAIPKEKKETESILAKLKKGLGKAGHVVASGASKAAKKAQESPELQKALMGAGAAALSGGGAAAVAKAAMNSYTGDAPADDDAGMTEDDDAGMSDDDKDDQSDDDEPMDENEDASDDTMVEDEDEDAPSDEDEPMDEDEDAPSDEDEPMDEDEDAPSDDDEPMDEDEDAPSDDDEPMDEDEDAPSDDDEPMNEDEESSDEDEPMDEDEDAPSDDDEQMDEDE